jgi:hypothetical protein
VVGDLASLFIASRVLAALAAGLALIALVNTLTRVRESEPEASTPPAGVRMFDDVGPRGATVSELEALPPDSTPPEPATRPGNALDYDSDPPTLRVETPNAVILPSKSAASDGADARKGATRSRVAVWAGLAGLTACAVASLVLGVSALRRDDVATTQTTVSSALEAIAPSSSSPPPSGHGVPAVSPPALFFPSPTPPPPRPAPTSTVGDLITPLSAHAHRVFVDGRCAADSSGATLSVRCGRHTVRIGSHGASQTVDVSCGGSISVDVP